MAQESDVRVWKYLDSQGTEKGPIPTSILMRLLEKGVLVTGQNHVWTAGMNEWRLMTEVFFPFHFFFLFS